VWGLVCGCERRCACWRGIEGQGVRPYKRKDPVRISVAEANRRADLQRDGERLIRDLLAICGNDFGIQAKVALPQLIAIHDAPWRNYADVGLSEAKMVELLAVFKIQSKQSKRFSKDRGNLRGYLRSDLGSGHRREDALQRPGAVCERSAGRGRA
jgi:hypothetical protein